MHKRKNLEDMEGEQLNRKRAHLTFSLSVLGRYSQSTEVRCKTEVLDREEQAKI
jgi:hypothetical protein